MSTHSFVSPNKKPTAPGLRSIIGAAGLRRCGWPKNPSQRPDRYKIKTCQVLYLRIRYTRLRAESIFFFFFKRPNIFVNRQTLDASLRGCGSIGNLEPLSSIIRYWQTRRKAATQSHGSTAAKAATTARLPKMIQSVSLPSACLDIHQARLYFVLLATLRNSEG